MNEVATLSTANFSDMAKAMGIAGESDSATSKALSLARLRLTHDPIMGQKQIDGKKMNLEVVPAGSYRLEIPEVGIYYSTDVSMRIFAQRFMYKRFVKGTKNTPNMYVKTVMSDNLNKDLKDNMGGFNCGKPAGYIQDFKALPKDTQELIKTIKRVRVVFGIIEFNNAVDEKGNEVSLDSTPFIWEIDNREAYKHVGEVVTKFARMKRLLPQHEVSCSTESRDLPNGKTYYVPALTADFGNVLELDVSEQASFSDFMTWVENYNVYITNQWSEKAMEEGDDLQDGDADIIDAIIEMEDEVA